MIRHERGSLARLIWEAECYERGFVPGWPMKSVPSPPLAVCLVLRKAVHDLRALDSLVVRTKDVLCSCGSNWHQSMTLEAVAARHPEHAGTITWLIMVLGNIE